MNESELTTSIILEIADVRKYLIAAQDVLKTGFMPDLSSLEKRVASLCENIKKIPQPDQKRCLPDLMALVKQLNDVERDMRVFYETKIAGKTHGTS